MSDIFFGWLIKGKCEVALLDVLILFVEIGFIFIVIYYAEKIYRSFRK